MVEIRYAEDNLITRTIPERLGFIQEGIIRNDELLDGNYTKEDKFFGIHGK